MMEVPLTKPRRQAKAPMPVFLPNELISEILSLLSVKTLIRFRCMSKSWNTLISDRSFVEMHLKRSAQNSHLLTLMRELMTAKLIPSTCLMNSGLYQVRSKGYSLVSFPVRRLLENPSISVTGDNCHHLKDSCRVVGCNDNCPHLKDNCRVIGSCNGLLCLLYCSIIRTPTYAHRKNWLCFWNPATRTRSEKLGSFCEYSNNTRSDSGSFKFTFGCDDSTRTYKVVAFRAEFGRGYQALWRSEVRVFSLGDNCWREIHSFPVRPLDSYMHHNDGVHLSGTINWLAHGNNFMPFYNCNVEQFVIVSLDLSTETYTQLLPPQVFDEVPCKQPILRVMLDCLCFSHDFGGTEFVIWQMKQFGVQESWTQLLKISYENLQIKNLPMDDDSFEYIRRLLPLCLSENGDTLILANDAKDDQAIIYNWRDNKVERTGVTNTNNIRLCWFSSMDYVESLVLTR